MLVQVLVNASGTQWNPVRDLKLTGIKYTAAARPLNSILIRITHG